MLLEEDGQGGRGRPGGAEGGYIFVGDTGEGDPLAGEMMCDRHPERMRAVFLHVVSDAARQGAVSVPADRVVNGVPVVYFRTYVGAAVKAVRLGLMDRAGLDKVIVAAKEMMVKVPPNSSKWVDINRDIMAAETGEAVKQTLLQQQTVGIETLTLTLGEALAPKKVLDAAKRRPAVGSIARRGGAGVATKPRQ
ncbi:unnamed protein product [Laminaria digitata]